MTTSKNNIPCKQCGFDPTLKVDYRLKIPYVWKSGNKTGANKKHSNQYRRYRDKFARILGGFIDRITRQGDNIRQVRMVRLYGKRKRPYDRDNLVWGAKPLVDAMKSYGIIADDRENVAKIFYSQERSPDDTDYVLIEVTDV